MKKIYRKMNKPSTKTRIKIRQSNYTDQDNSKELKKNVATQYIIRVLDTETHSPS